MRFYLRIFRLQYLRAVCQLIKFHSLKKLKFAIFFEFAILNVKVSE
jgi:hypothetical protein